jgi:hypothetical protein
MPYYVKTFEWHALLLNIKPAVFLEYGAREYESIKALAPFYRSHGLKYALWNMRAKPLARYKDTKNRRSFGGLFLGKKTQLIDRLIAAYQADDTMRIGRLLGYPACCVERMAAGLSEDPEDGLHTSNNAMVAGLPFSGESRRFYTPEMNFLSHYDGRIADKEIFKRPAFSRIFSRLFPFTLSDHFPCSLSCGESSARGKLVSAVIKKTDPGWYSSALEINGNPVLYLDNFRFYILAGKATFKEIKFLKIIFASETASALYRALKKADRVRVEDKTIRLFHKDLKLLELEASGRRPAILPFHNIQS